MNTRTNTSAVRSAFSVLAVALIAGSAIAAEPVRVAPPPQKVVEPATRCNPDYNHSGTVDVYDIFDFLTGWFANKPDADANGNGILEGLDVLEFINSWLAGPITPAGK